MPLIFASSLLGLPLALARLTDSAALEGAASALGPGGALYLPINVALIAFFNYYYTFLQVGLYNVGRAAGLPPLGAIWVSLSVCTDDMPVI